MPKIEIPYPLRAYVEGQLEFEATTPAQSVGELLQQLTNLYPRIKPHLLSDNGQLRKFILLYLNDEDIRYKGGLDAALHENTIVKIIPAIAGGNITPTRNSDLP